MKLARRSHDFSLTEARFAIPFAIWLLALCVVLLAVCFVRFEQYETRDCIEYARGINGLVVDTLDADRVNEFLEHGHQAAGYDETEQYLYKLRDAYPDVEYLYVYQIQEDGCHVVFDLDAPDLEGSEPGDVVEFDNAFLDKLDDLLAGKEVEPIISDDTYGYLLTVYTPVYDSKGTCVCYAAVDFSMNEMRDYTFTVIADVAKTGSLFVAISAIAFLFFAFRGVVKPMQDMEEKAYHDELTGTKNKAAYADLAEKLDQEIADAESSKNTPAFAILMVDVNFLKRVNDTYGHEKGDEYLIASAAAICRAFGSDHVYRYGGDEFVAVLEGDDVEHAQDMIRDLKHQVEDASTDTSLEEWQRISCAVGMATYEESRDTCVEDVLKRADAAMYEDKKAMKAERRD